MKVGGYHRRGRAASDHENGATACPLCPRRTDRFGWCRIGHPAVQARGVTYTFEDHRHNLAVDPDAAVVTWRQENGHRLGWENSREALAWSFFRGIEVLGVADAVLGGVFGLGRPLELYFWGRRIDATPWEPFAEARAALERHLKGPDVNSAEPELVVVDRARAQVLFLDADHAAPVATARAPIWFAAAGRPAERRVKRAILEALMGEEEAPFPFRRGLDDAIRRGFYGLARRLLTARATARRLGEGWTGRLASVIHPPTMRRAEEDVARFRELLAPGAEAAYAAVTWATLWERVPSDARTARRGASPTPLRLSLEEYLRSRTVNRQPAGFLGKEPGDPAHVS